MTRNRFFTADQHFGHANILKYEDEMRRDSYYVVDHTTGFTDKDAERLIERLNK